ncbi:transcriptional repressor [Nowakowskiella sp. JEL0407]|nr:transcriptional repressor [Nowakowskiella sp. JEL0407]
MKIASLLNEPRSPTSFSTTTFAAPVYSAAQTLPQPPALSHSKFSQNEPTNTIPSIFTPTYSNYRPQQSSALAQNWQHPDNNVYFKPQVPQLPIPNHQPPQVVYTQPVYEGYNPAGINSMQIPVPPQNAFQPPQQPVQPPPQQFPTFIPSHKRAYSTPNGAFATHSVHPPPESQSHQRLLHPQMDAPYQQHHDFNSIKLPELESTANSLIRRLPHLNINGQYQQNTEFVSDLSTSQPKIMVQDEQASLPPTFGSNFGHGGGGGGRITRHRRTQSASSTLDMPGVEESTKRRHVCHYEGCGKNFSTSGHLARHRRLHTGAKPFSCPIDNCTSRFNRHDNMLQHWRSHQRKLSSSIGNNAAAIPMPPPPKAAFLKAPQSDNGKGENKSDPETEDQVSEMTDVSSTLQAQLVPGHRRHHSYSAPGSKNFVESVGSNRVPVVGPKDDKVLESHAMESSDTK